MASLPRIGDNPPVRTVDTEITYVEPGSFINRRFVAAGVEVNTGTYRPYPVKIGDARPMQESFRLDTHGFELFMHKSAVGDFMDKAQVDAKYPAEVTELMQRLTGADLVVPLGWMVRTSGDLSGRKKVVGYTHRGGIQPPAGEAHVDFTPECAEYRARENFQRLFPGSRPYTRFIASSLWRAFSPPPQDWPLALCDGRSLADDEGTPNTLVVVDQIPDRETMLGKLPAELEGMNASIFHYSPNHRWWYYSNMNRDEVVLLKFYDSDHSRAWRAPHTAFRDPSFPDVRIRESIELRSFAYFL
ncbi:MAG: hypothetical protein HYY48_06580 [Gammaproteobacteria bacterium]|nr:hypothetical protein [Gammaproteobacteria bacterium]